MNSAETEPGSHFLAQKLVLILVVLFYVPYLHVHGFRLNVADQVDFPAFYAAARVTFVQGVSPFTADAFSNAESLLGEPAPMTLTGRKIPPYLYPPPSLLLFYPLKLLSFRSARWSMLALSHLCVLPMVYLLCAKLIGPTFAGNIRRHAAPLCLIYTLVSYPIVANFEYGQINIIVLLLLCLAWYAVMTKRAPLLVALPLGIAILLKTYPVLLLPLLLLRKQYRTVAWTLALLLLATMAAAIVLPRPVWHDWITNVLPSGGYLQETFNLFSPAQSRNHSINGFFSRLCTANQFSETLWPYPQIGRILGYFVALVICGVTLVVSWVASSRANAPRLCDLQFCLFLIMMVLVAPLSWESHLVFLLPAAIMAIYLLATSRRSWSYQCLVVLCLCLIAWYLAVDSRELSKGLWTLVIPAKFYATLVLWWVFVDEVWRFRDDPALEARPSMRY